MGFAVSASSESALSTFDCWCTMTYFALQSRIDWIQHCIHSITHLRHIFTHPHKSHEFSIKHCLRSTLLIHVYRIQPHILCFHDSHQITLYFLYLRRVFNRMEMEKLIAESDESRTNAMPHDLHFSTSLAYNIRLSKVLETTIVPSNSFPTSANRSINWNERTHDSIFEWSQK